MTRRFSPQELTSLRNQAPIHRVIETWLALPTRQRGGKLAFACPLCGGFDTSINPGHNLARCFDCRQNFNPIELVMYQLKIGFVESVKWLKNRTRSEPYQHTVTTERPNNQMTALSDIINDMLPTLSEKIKTSSQDPITQRLTNLEHSVKQIYSMLHELRSRLDQ